MATPQTLEEIDAERQAALAEMEAIVARIRRMLDDWDDPVEAIGLGGMIDLYDEYIALLRRHIEQPVKH